jgi:hypothetical protein
MRILPSGSVLVSLPAYQVAQSQKLTNAGDTTGSACKLSEPASDVMPRFWYVLSLDWGWLRLIKDAFVLCHQQQMLEVQALELQVLVTNRLVGRRARELLRRLANSERQARRLFEARRQVPGHYLEAMQQVLVPALLELCCPSPLVLRLLVEGVVQKLEAEPSRQVCLPVLKVH